MLNNYITLSNGVIHQYEKFEGVKICYDINYIKNRYDLYKNKSLQMSYLRLGYLMGILGSVPNSLLDVGYGNGDFLNVCKHIIPHCYGNEINNYPLPDGVKFADTITDNYDVICFFDVLEHFENISIIKNINAKFIYISIPECHYFSDDWFLNWKHRRPNEHIWHFNKNALQNFFTEFNYKLINFSNIEDTIRDKINGNSNILSGVFVKC